jgi:hypothetical protein
LNIFENLENLSLNDILDYLYKEKSENYKKEFDFILMREVKSYYLVLSDINTDLIFLHKYKKNQHN